MIPVKNESFFENISSMQDDGKGGREKTLRTEIQVDTNYSNVEIPTLITGSAKKMPGTPSERHHGGHHSLSSNNIHPS
jgi:hypothetical protein